MQSKHKSKPKSSTTNTSLTSTTTKPRSKTTHATTTTPQRSISTNSQTTKSLKSIKSTKSFSTTNKIQHSLSQQQSTSQFSTSSILSPSSTLSSPPTPRSSSTFTSHNNQHPLSTPQRAIHSLSNQSSHSKLTTQPHSANNNQHSTPLSNKHPLNHLSQPSHNSKSSLQHHQRRLFGSKPSVDVDPDQPPSKLPVEDLVIPKQPERHVDRSKLFYPPAQPKPWVAPEYSSGDEIDQTEEEKNKHLVAVGKFGLPPAQIRAYQEAQKIKFPRHPPFPFPIPQKYHIFPKGTFTTKPVEMATKLLTLKNQYIEKRKLAKRRPPRNPDDPNDVPKITKIQRKFDLEMIEPSHRSPAQIEELAALAHITPLVTKEDEDEYAEDQKEWDKIFNKYKITHRSFDLDACRVETFEDAIEKQKQGWKVARLDFHQSEKWFEDHADEQYFVPEEVSIEKNYPKKGGPNYDLGDEDISEDAPGYKRPDSDDPEEANALHPSQRYFSLLTEPLPPKLTTKDYKQILQKLYGQPEQGNPNLLYIPGIKPIWRQEEFDLDKNGNMLPVNYNHHHLHNPYEFFEPDTSLAFDPPMNPVDDWDDYRRRFSYAMMTWEEELLATRNSIKCPTELHAFDAVMTSQLLPEFYTHFLSPDDSGKPYSDRHWLYEALNHPDPEQRYIPPAEDFDDVDDFFFYDISLGPKKLRLQTLTAFGIIFGFGGLLALDGLLFWNQYFYDLQYPVHEH